MSKSSNGKHTSEPSLSSVKESRDSADEDETSSIASGSTANTSRSATPTLNALKRKKKKRGRQKINKNVSPNINYKYNGHVKEDHNSNVFAVNFFTFFKGEDPLVFATVGNNRVSVYECLPNAGMKLLQAYADPENEEAFYTCAWTYDPENSHALLAVAGLRGKIRIIDTVTGLCILHLLGHGQAVNELKFHPQDPFLLLSVSKDHTLHLWNIKTAVLIATFSSDEAHRDEVLSADIHPSGNKIISCGMDHSLKIWRIDKPHLQEKIRDSYNYDARKARKTFPTYHGACPDFSTRDVHKNYVDCVRWYLDMVISKSCCSKSCKNCIVLWKPGRLDEDEEFPKNGTASIIHDFKHRNCDIWFVKFSLDYFCTVMAVGNLLGHTYVYDLSSEDISQAPYTVLTHPKCVGTIRQTAFSEDGSILLCVCDDGTIWRWDRKKLPQSPASGEMEKA